LEALVQILARLWGQQPNILGRWRRSLAAISTHADSGILYVVPYRYLIIYSTSIPVKNPLGSVAFGQLGFGSTIICDISGTFLIINTIKVK
jgi:hypothetical protein